MTKRLLRECLSFLLPAAAILAVAGCQTVQTTRPGAVGVERQQVMVLSSAEVNRGAQQAYRQTIGQAAAKGTLNRDPAQVARVRSIANRLIAATGVFRFDAPSWKWEVNVISSREINAWAMPGGKIVVYTGLLERLGVTDDELAAILGHEMAHALREHGRERASQQLAQELALGVISVAAGLGPSGTDLARIVADVTYGLPNSREFEREADRIGVELAARSGFDPRAAISLWQKMSRVGGGGPPEFLSTHPSDESRIRDLQGYVARVMPLYEQSRRR